MAGRRVDDAPMRPSGPFLRPSFWGPALGLLALIVALAAPVLLAPTPLVLSEASNDGAHYFLHTTAFVARSLATGEIPFWNPHIFAGIPFVGGFQSAVFYPGTLLFLALPGNEALNLSIVLHLFLAGAFAMGVVVRRGAGAAAAALAGSVVALGGPLFPHVWGGHLTLLWAYPWTILALAATDALLDGGGRRAAGVAGLALGLGLLAGHPQTVFHAAVAALLWAAIRLPRGPWRSCVPGLAGAAVLGLALAAVQVWPAVVEAPYGVRGRLSAEQAALFSLPVENLLTLVAPGFFGGGPVAPYWGRAYFWEMSLFLGVVTLPLVVLGVARRGRGTGPIAAVAAALLVLALGANGPLFAPLHALGAGFDRIRGWSKFSLPLAFFAALLAAEGVERVRAGAVSLRMTVGVAVAALLVAGAGAVLAGGDAGAARVAGFVESVQAKAAARGETWLPEATWRDPGFAPHAAAAGARQLLGAGAALGLAAGLLVLARRRPGLGAAVLAGIGVAELAAFAAPLAVGFDPAPFRFDAVRTHLAEQDRTGRILNVLLPNAAMTIGAREVGGYDPGVPRRTAELLQFSQGRSVDALAQHSRFESAPDLFTMFRLGTVVFLEEGRLRAEDFPLAPLAPVSLRERFEVIPDRDAALARLADPTFDATTSVLLEAMPEPAPQPGGAAGTASVVAEGNGELVVSASVPAPALLLVTDAYHPLWVAEALPGSAQPRYEILPANRCLRAVPLGPGEHRIRMVYRVPGFAAATGVSVVAAAALLGLLGWPRRGARGDGS